MPACMWSAPLVRVGLAPQWERCWHAYRRLLPFCQRVFTDSLGANLLQQAGLSQTRPGNVHFCDRAPEDSRQIAHPRDIDVLHVGDFSPAVPAERSRWLWRLARLRQRWHIEVRPRLASDSYRKLLTRARIVLLQGACETEAFAAAATGALVFQQHHHHESSVHLRDRQECVCYDSNDLESLLEHYLNNEDERKTMTDAARLRVQQFRFDDCWSLLVQQVEADWAQLHNQQPKSQEQRSPDVLLGRCLHALSSRGGDDLFLLAELAKTLGPANAPAANTGDGKQKAWLRLAMGLVLCRQALGKTHAAAAAEVAAEHFRQVLELYPKSVLAGLNLAEALEAAGQKLPAIEAARRTLEVLSCKPDLDEGDLEGLLFPRGVGVFQAEWERAAWMHPGRPSEEIRAKRNLLAWRLFSLLGQCTQELGPHYEATMLCPEMPSSQAALGVALARAGKVCEARPHLVHAVAGNPLDRSAARALCHAFAALGDVEGRRAFLEDQRLLQRVVPALVPLEPWFAEPPPNADELASLIVVCCNQVEITRQCLASILRHTRSPYELIVVDNGSTDDTPSYLNEVRSWPNPKRVEIIRNATNLGHPAALNQALLQARGRYVVFLDNDTVVTPGWLDGLIYWCLQDWPRNGFVGPVTNGAPDVQAIPPGYGQLKDLDAFAKQRRQEFAGKMLANPRLTSFCLLARRDVLECIGNWDERFHPGFFVDDDLSVRAREAGYRLVVALDVYVHHFGHRTFEQLGIDSRRQLAENFQRFEDKWGKEYTTGYQMLPPADALSSALMQDALAQPNGEMVAPVVDAPTPLPGVSLCMIVKNEERHLPDCLRSTDGVFDEIVVVDTGSTDRTKEVAQHYAAHVFDFPWVESFAAARNECLRHARHKWILWLDADDRLDEENRGRLKQVLAGLGDEKDAYAMKVRSVLDADGTVFRLLDQVRLFRNLPAVRWDYRIHEQILPAVNRIGGVVRWADVVIDHVGYQDAGARKSKLERNLRILELDYGERPQDGFTLFNLGWTLLDLGRTDEALQRLKQALDNTRPTSSTLRKLYHLLTVAHRTPKPCDEALAMCREGLKKFPDDAELLFEEGVLLRDRDDLLGAEQSWLRLLETPRGQYFASEEVGLRGFRTRQFLAEIYRAQERCLEAEVQWRAALKERLDFEPAWMNLAELYLKQARGPDLEYLLEELEKAGLARAKVGWLRARGQAHQKNFAAARRTLLSVMAQDPSAIGPRVLYSQILLQEGRDWEAAEQALRDVLTLEPEHAETKHNLNVLLRRLGREQ
ncbi:MAG: glycosyltransferase, partial [Gemmataceae bacterium]|nr:glycosyltransferase [Gemmataceae bacterium]